MNICIWMGWADILIPRPEPQAILEAVAKYKVNFFPAVPTMYVGVLNHPKFSQFNLTSIKGAFSGAAPLPVEVIRDFEAKTGSQICEGYGLSETSPFASTNPFGGKTKVGSIGLPVSDTDFKIVDLVDGTKELPVGEAGEVLIKGPQVMSGYYKMPEETANALGTLKPDEEKQVTYRITPEWSTDLVFEISYRNGPNQHNETLTLPVKIGDGRLLQSL